MRAVVQRVSRAEVAVEGQTIASIGRGLLALVSFGPDDTEKDLEYMAGKIIGLRIFEDEEGRMNLALADAGGELLVVPNFTIHGDCRKGRRPSFSGAAPPDLASSLFDRFAELAARGGVPVQTGRFGAHMHVSLVNDGPVTLLLDSRRRF